MKKREFEDILVIDADPGKYLAISGRKDSEILIGKPERIVLKNTGIIPVFEEREVTE